MYFAKYKELNPTFSTSMHFHIHQMPHGLVFCKKKNISLQFTTLSSNNCFWMVTSILLEETM